MVANRVFGEDGVGPNGCQAGVGSWVTLSLLPASWQQLGLPLHFLQSILIDSGCWATNSGEPHRKLRLQHSFSSSSRERGWSPRLSPPPGISHPTRMSLAALQGSFARKRRKPPVVQQGERVGCSPSLCCTGRTWESSPTSRWQQLPSATLLGVPGPARVVATGNPSSYVDR